MSISAAVILPNQLFKQNPILTPKRMVFLVEEWHYFNQSNFHKEKLVLHRASMKFYEQYLRGKGYKVVYIEAIHDTNKCEKLIDTFKNYKISEIHLVNPIDYWVSKKIQSSCQKNKIDLQVYDNPNFLNTAKGVNEYFNKKKTYFQTDFYTWQRKERNILIDNKGKPQGGKWTYDADNRSKFPKKEIVPKIQYAKNNAYLEEATKYIEKNFSNNYGTINQQHLFTINFIDSEKWLKEFLQNRFEKFGIYEDAIVANESVLHHSVLSPMLNIGLLDPQQIINQAIEISSKQNIPLNSLEGFIRQIMGWREFIKIVYEREGTKQRTKNYWNFNRKIPKCFWDGTTGIAPIDITIKKILKTGYCHHIERLMVLGNFMLLCEFDPDEVYKWFMEMFVDAYDWVMVPNVYGMTQFADGGLMTTKPYISGSNYLMKMSDYEKGEWQQVWDGLFWRFMHVHRNFFLSNPRIGMLVHTYDKMSKEKQNMHLSFANDFLNKLDKAT